MKIKRIMTQVALMCAVVVGSMAVGSAMVVAETIKTRQAFIQDAFSNLSDPATQELPKIETLWINKAIREAALEKTGYVFQQLRLRYWGKGERTAWILDEVGKEQPITLGVVIEDGQIAAVETLIYRESRGWEVKHAFFTKQFLGATLVEKKKAYKLSESIDGITGATLSVRAVKKVATLALFLHQLTPYSSHDKEQY